MESFILVGSLHLPQVEKKFHYNPKSGVINFVFDEYQGEIYSYAKDVARRAESATRSLTHNGIEHEMTLPEPEAIGFTFLVWANFRITVEKELSEEEVQGEFRRIYWLMI